MHFDYKEFHINASPLDEGATTMPAQRSTGAPRWVAMPSR